MHVPIITLVVEIVAGRPVIVWVAGQMWPGVAQSYFASDGKQVIVAAYEHTMIMVGDNPTTVYAVDAFSGRTIAYSHKVFMRSWTTLGRLAVTDRGKHKTDSATVNEEMSNAPSNIWLPVIVAQMAPHGSVRLYQREIQRKR